MVHKMAIIGFGGMGGWHYRNITEKISDIKVIGAYDVLKESQDKILENNLKLYNSPEEIYADKEIDLVLIATPNDFHKSYSINALKAGKNVVCEKPVTLNKAELEEIIKVAEETNKMFSVHQNRRWDSDFLTVQKILNDKILNKPYIIESRVQGSRRALHGWRGYKTNGGGMVLDWGVHLIDQALWLFNEKVVSVNAHLHNVFAPEVDDNFTAMLRFESGITYIVNIAMNCFITQPRWHVSCEDGTAVIDNWEVNGKIVKLSEDNDTISWDEEIVYTAAGPTRSMAPRPKNTTQEIPLPVIKGDWTAYYKNIVDVLDNKAKLIVTPQQALRVMEVIDAIFESDKTGCALKCSI